MKTLWINNNLTITYGKRENGKGTYISEGWNVNTIPECRPSEEAIRAQVNRIWGWQIRGVRQVNLKTKDWTADLNSTRIYTVYEGKRAIYSSRDQREAYSFLRQHQKAYGGSREFVEQTFTKAARNEMRYSGKRTVTIEP